jgi:exopolysaccharide biosynthesis glucuronosyltransferase PssD
MRILAISSAGGHWEQLMMLSGSFAGYDVLYASTAEGLSGAAAGCDPVVVRDCNRNTPVSVIFCLYDVYKLLKNFRPNFVVTTGAAPGLVALVVGKVLGAKGIWIDSVANSERLSLSGRLVSVFADLRLTQWEHLSSPGGPKYLGSVL